MCKAEELREYPSPAEFLKTKRRLADSKPEDEIVLDESGADEVKVFIEKHCTTEQKARLAQVARQVWGFETPFGIELLATVHWAARAANDKQLTDVVRQVRQWPKNPERKARLFSEKHVEKAWQRLSES